MGNVGPIWDSVLLMRRQRRKKAREEEKEIVALVMVNEIPILCRTESSPRRS